MRRFRFDFALINPALLLVDVQNDFLESGALPIPKSNEIIPLLNQLQINQLQKCFVHVVATKDWHCENHTSFLTNSNDKGWPVHCIQNTWGSDFPSTLNDEKIKAVFLKGRNKNHDSYSGFYDDCGKKNQTGLLDYLKFNSIDTVFITGLALDFCVKATAIGPQSRIQILFGNRRRKRHLTPTQSNDSRA